MDALVDTVFTAIFVPCQNQSYHQSFQSSCLLVRVFLGKFWPK